jgi:hypothetical protein
MPFYPGEVERLQIETSFRKIDSEILEKFARGIPLILHIKTSLPYPIYAEIFDSYASKNWNAYLQKRVSYVTSRGETSPISAKTFFVLCDSHDLNLKDWLATKQPLNSRDEEQWQRQFKDEIKYELHTKA